MLVNLNIYSYTCKYTYTHMFTTSVVDHKYTTTIIFENDSMSLSFSRIRARPLSPPLYHVTGGECPRGRQCRFAHNIHELGQVFYIVTQTRKPTQVHEAALGEKIATRACIAESKSISPSKENQEILITKSQKPHLHSKLPEEMLDDKLEIGLSSHRTSHNTSHNTHLTLHNTVNAAVAESDKKAFAMLENLFGFTFEETLRAGDNPPHSRLSSGPSTIHEVEESAQTTLHNATAGKEALLISMAAVGKCPWKIQSTALHCDASGKYSPVMDELTENPAAVMGLSLMSGIAPLLVQEDHCLKQTCQYGETCTFGHKILRNILKKNGGEMSASVLCSTFYQHSEVGCAHIRQGHGSFKAFVTTTPLKDFVEFMPDGVGVVCICAVWDACMLQ